MSQPEQPQIYLLTPPMFELSWIASTLAPVLDAVPVACVRLALVSQDAGEIGKLADHTREVAHARDIPVVISGHAKLADLHGLDGVHLNGHASYRDARKVLGLDAIVGCYCGASRHSGLTAGEMGADYVSFGPVTDDPLIDSTPAQNELFAWWSDMIEVPVVAEGALTPETAKELAPITDFVALGSEIWGTEDPAQAARRYLDAIS